MKIRILAQRNAKEILRDKLNLLFGIGFPLVLLGLMTLIQKNIPVALFEIETLAPGIATFGLSFFTLFAATLLSKDRAGAFMMRLTTAPISVWELLLGYALPLLPLALCQAMVCYGAALLLGLEMRLPVLWAVLAAVPAAFCNIALGLFFGSILSDKQVGGICGAFLTNLSAWLSGAWFDIDLVGGAFAAIAKALPFYHSVEAGRAIFSGADVGRHILLVFLWAAGLLCVACFTFIKKAKAD